MLTIPNLLSCLRAPLALLFLSENPIYRFTAIILAACSDSLDGYLARRWHATSRLGTTLDPIMDKFFVCFVMMIFLSEGRLQPWQALTLLSRDFAIALFGLYLVAKDNWSKFRVRAIWSGKIATTLQFFVLGALSLGFTIPSSLFLVFIILGALSLVELACAPLNPSNTSSPDR